MRQPEVGHKAFYARETSDAAGRDPVPAFGSVGQGGSVRRLASPAMPIVPVPHSAKVGNGSRCPAPRPPARPVKWLRPLLLACLVLLALCLSPRAEAAARL